MGNNKEPIPELQFPLVFPKCPVCGCEETVAERVKDEEIAKGKIKTQIHAAMSRSMTPVADQRAIITLLSVPMLVSFYDVCARCGSVRAVRIEKGEALIGPDKPPPGMPGMPGMGRQPFLGL